MFVAGDVSMHRSLLARLLVFLLGPLALLALLALVPYLARAENQDIALQIRDETLIGALVNTALTLAHESDDLARADGCRRLVVVIADDLQKSVKNGQLDRAAALAAQAGSLLSDGVAANLRSAQTAAKASGRQAEIDRIAVEATRLCDQLTHLADLPGGSQSPEYRRAFDGVHKARVAIEQALVPR
jgi:hypothetical protein